MNKDKGIPSGRCKCIKCGKYKNNKTSYRFYASRFDKNGYRARMNSVCRLCENKHNRQLALIKKTCPPCPEYGTPCPICLIPVHKEHKGRKNRWTCDHDHDTGKFRDWICHKCNNAIGRFNEDIDTIQRAAEYLKEKK